MEEVLVLGETFKIAKLKGFPNHIKRPTQSLVQKWLREIHNIQANANSHSLQNGKWSDYVASVDAAILNDARDEEFKTYEEALEVALEYALNLLPDWKP